MKNNSYEALHTMVETFRNYFLTTQQLDKAVFEDWQEDTINMFSVFYSYDMLSAEDFKKLCDMITAMKEELKENMAQVVYYNTNCKNYTQHNNDIMNLLLSKLEPSFYVADKIQVNKNIYDKLVIYDYDTYCILTHLSDCDMIELISPENFEIMLGEAKES